MSDTAAEVLSWHMHTDYVSGLCYNAGHNTLLSVAGDTTLCAYDIRAPTNAQRSDEQEAELHCVLDIKDGRKVVCGTDDGILLVFSWGRWGDCTDRFVGHTQAVDCMMKVDETMLLTGSSDGALKNTFLNIF
jgi:WD40 repeat protein